MPAAWCGRGKKGSELSGRGAVVLVLVVSSASSSTATVPVAIPSLSPGTIVVGFPCGIPWAGTRVLPLSDWWEFLRLSVLLLVLVLVLLLLGNTNSNTMIHSTGKPLLAVQFETDG